MLRFMTSWTLWNLALAAVPVALGYLFASRRWSGAGRGGLTRAAWVAVGLLWLAFVPNTGYLLTEWRHFLEHVDRRGLALGAQDDPRLLLAIATRACFYAAYSGFGVLALTLAVRPVERRLREARVPFAAAAPVLFGLISLGVYLGLVLRLNSWDLWERPGRVLEAIADVPARPWLASAVVLFAAGLWGLYEAVDLWLDAAAERVRPRLARLARPLSRVAARP